MKNKTILPALLLVFGSQVYFQKKWVEIPKRSYTIVQNRGGQALGYSPNSGVKIIQVEVLIDIIFGKEEL